MASAPSEPRPITGRVDRAGRLVAADAELATLQMEAGSSIGSTLALPQVAAVARLARKLGIPVSRPAIAAGSNQDIELWVRAIPEGEEVSLTLEGWTTRPVASPRLATLLGGDSGESRPAPEPGEWSADEDLQLTSVSASLAEKLGAEAAELIGKPLMRIFRLEENDAGELPLVAALAARHGFAGQPARARNGDPGVTLTLSGEVMFGADGSFAGFSGRAASSDDGAAHPVAQPLAIDQALNEALRTPLDRIIDAAERIADRADGPLRNDYAAYASDISSAARHLLSVIHSISEEPGQGHRTVDLATLAAEAAVLIAPTAEARGVRIALEPNQALPANGEERAVIQILVNLIGNAVRHSPSGGTVALSFALNGDVASVIVSDQGEGIAPADQQRIFERFERANADEGGTGLGLAISRRLARSMGGDISLESVPTMGARFTLSLPSG
ncbi:MAG: HAMP domain-containing sensor histidine kinase [Sphingomicrobium sp.]